MSSLIAHPRRRRLIRLSAVCLIASLVTCGPTLGGPRDEAEALFERYSLLEAAFDPAVAELYADDAVIRNRRVYPGGRVREITLPGTQYKALIRSVMPLAKRRGDYNVYSDVSYAEEPPGVRIRATRFSMLKKYASPISILVAPGASKRWLIREEISESRP